MHDSYNLQRDVFRRALKLHSIKSSGENLDLLTLALDDQLIFELAYSRVVSQIVVSNEIEFSNPNGEQPVHQIEFHCCGQLLSWLSKNRAEILIEIHLVVQDLGGIEVADYLLEEVGKTNCCQVH